MSNHHRSSPELDDAAPAALTGTGEDTTAAASAADGPSVYSPPRLRRLGSVRELTLGSGVAGAEAGGTFKFH